MPNMPGKTTVAIAFDAEKLRAARFYAGKKGAEAEPELIGCLQRFYEKYVPAATREYIESAADLEPQTRPTRPARSHSAPTARDADE